MRLLSVLKKRRLPSRPNRVSIYTVFVNIPTYFYLLLIPVVQNYLFDPKGFFEHIASYGVSLLMAGAAAAISAADYTKRSFTLTKCCVEVSQGLFVRSEYSVPYSRLRYAAFEQTPFMRSFSAVKIMLSASRTDKRQCVFYLPYENAVRLKREMSGELGCLRSEISSDSRQIFLMSALLSNPVSGLLAAAPIVRGIGRAVGDQLSRELLRTLDLSQYLLFLGIPPAAAFITYFLLLCYAVGAAVMFLKNGGLRCEFYDNGMVLKYGVIGKKSVFIPPGSVEALVMTQSVFMLPFKRWNGCVRLLGERESCLTLFSAVAKRSDVCTAFEQLWGDLPEFSPQTHKGRFRPLRFALMPIAAILAEIFLYSALVISGRSGGAVTAVFIIAVIFSVVWLLFRLYASRFCSVSSGGGFVRIRKFRRLTLIDEIRRQN